MFAILAAILMGPTAPLGATGGDIGRAAPLQLLDESVRQGPISELNFTGQGVSCSRASARGTCSIDAGAATGDVRLNSTYQSQAAITLYVDKTGSDSNACTANLTSACLTINGALGKLPRFNPYNVAIYVDAGTYTENVVISDKYFDRSNTFLISGATLTTYSPATGTATGTLTGYTATSATTPGVLADTSQSWTVNNLRGRFVTITSGGASGQRRPIASNTATTIEIAGNYTTNPAAGATYSIDTPSTIISGTTSVASNITVSNGGAAFMTLTQLELTSSGATLAVDNQNFRQFSLNTVRVVSSSASSAAYASPSLRAAGPVVLHATGSGNSAWSLNGHQTPGAAWNTGTAVYMRADNARAVQVSSRLAPLQFAGMNNVLIETGSSSASVIEIASSSAYASVGVSVTSTTFGFLRCPAGGSGAGLYFNIQGAAPVSFYLSRMSFLECATGISATGVGSIPTEGALTFVNTTTAIDLNNGVTMNLADTPTFSGVTNEIDIDGTVYTYATLAALTPPLITGATTKTSIGAY